MRETRTEVVAYAGFWRRSSAYLIDCMIAFGLFGLTQLLIFAPLREAVGVDDEWFYSGVTTQIYTLLTVSIPVWLYFALFDSSRLQATPGKILLKLRVEKLETGAAISLPRAIVRTIIKLLPWEIAHLTNNLPEPMWYAPEPGFRWGFVVVLALLLGYVAAVLIHSMSRAPHDVAAGSVVVVRR